MISLPNIAFFNLRFHKKCLLYFKWYTKRLQSHCKTDSIPYHTIIKIWDNDGINFNMSEIIIYIKKYYYHLPEYEGIFFSFNFTSYFYFWTGNLTEKYELLLILFPFIHGILYQRKLSRLREMFSIEILSINERNCTLVL